MNLFIFCHAHQKSIKPREGEGGNNGINDQAEDQSKTLANQEIAGTEIEAYFSEGIARK